MKEKNIEITAILFMLTNANLFLYGIETFTKMSKNATIISVIIAFFLAYLTLHLLLKKKSLKYHHYLKFILIPTIFIQLNYVLRKITEFVSFNIVDISPYFIMISLLLLSYFALRGNFTSLIRSSFIYFFIIVFFTLITVITLTPKMDFESLLPLTNSDITSIIESSFLYYILSLSPYLYLSLFKFKFSKDNIVSLKKGFIITHIFIISYIILTIGILGNLTNIYSYPLISIFKKVSFLNILDRMESVFSLSYFLMLFVYFTFTVYLLLKEVKKEASYLMPLILGITFLFQEIVYIPFSLYFFTNIIYVVLLFFTNKTTCS